MSPGWKDVQDFLKSHRNVSSVVISSYFEWQLGLMARSNGNPFAWPRSLAELRDTASWPAATNATVAQWKGMIEELVANGTRRVYVVKPSVSFREPWHFGVQRDCLNSPDHGGKPSYWNMGEANRYSCCGSPEDGSGTRVASLDSMLAGKDSPRDAYDLVDEVTEHVLPLSVDEYYRTVGFVATPLMDAAHAAGAILLDPSSSICHNGLCPVIDPRGYRAFRDADHYRPSFMRAYGSFLDEALNLGALRGAQQPTEYCLPE